MQIFNDWKNIIVPNPLQELGSSKFVHITKIDNVEINRQVIMTRKVREADAWPGEWEVAERSTLVNAVLSRSTSTLSA